MSGFVNDIMVAENVDFRNVKPAVGQMTTDGDLLIGSTATPNIKKGQLQFQDGLSQITGSGTITITPRGAGNNNMFLGQAAGNLTVSGSGNFGYGTNSLHFITSGSNNCSYGANALLNTQAGDANIGVGYGACFTNVSGENNIAVGTTALFSSTGSRNYALGNASLDQLVSGNDNIGIGSHAGGAYTTSESGNIIIGNGGIIGDNNVTRIGENQTTAYIAGINGVFLSSAVPTVIDNSTGQMGVGYVSNSMFLGIGSGNSTVSGNYNYGYGDFALTALTSGNNNIAIGRSSLPVLEDGTDNISVGFFSLNSLVSGSSNVALGSNAGYNALGDANTAIGYQSLYNVLTGDNNLALGNQSGYGFVGSESNNICIGNQGTSGDNNIIRIGTDGSGAFEQNACYIAGINGVTVTGTAVLCAADGQLGTIASSRRYKDNIVDMSSDIPIMNLRPVEFTYKNDKSNSKQYGLIAEEVQESFPYLCFYGKDGKPESVKYHELPVLLLKQIQDMKKEIEQLKEKISKIS